MSEILAAQSDVLAAWPLYGTLPDVEQWNLLKSASELVLNFCRRTHFLQTMETETLNGKGLPRLWLSRKPVILVSTICINSVPVDYDDGDGWSWTPDTGELLLYSGQGQMRFARRFPHGRQNVVVQYWAGYTEVPDIVNRATIFAARWLWEQTKVTGIYASESIGDYSYSLNTANLRYILPDYIAAPLAHFVQEDGPC